MSKKIALVVPNLRWQKIIDEHTLWHFVPYNLCMLAANIRDICEVHIIDAYFENMTEEIFSSILIKHNYDMVGITVLMDQFAESGHKAAKIAKQTLNNTTIIMGGVYPTVNKTSILSDINIDYAWIGEGEEGFRAFIQYLYYNGAMPQKGLCYRENNGDIIIQPIERVENLNILPKPAYDLIDYPKYINEVSRKSLDTPTLYPYSRILTARGCPQNCCFCQIKIISGQKFRPRSPKNILDEIRWLKNTYDIKALLFEDDNISAQKSRAMKIFQGMIDENLVMPWKASTMAVFKLDEQLLDIMKKSGCQFICLAIESGSKRVLSEIISKPIDFSHAKKMVSHAQSLGIYVALNFILGFPGETYDEILETIACAEYLNADYVRFFAAIPLQHTRLWEICEKGGYFKDNFSIKNMSWNAGQIKSDHFTDEEITTLRAFEWDRINFTSHEKCLKTAYMLGITLDDLQKIRTETRHNAIISIKSG